MNPHRMIVAVFGQIVLRELLPNLVGGHPDDGVLAIGSGGSYALAAARALVAHTNLSAREIALEAMRIAGEICIYSNSNIVVEELG